MRFAGTDVINRPIEDVWAFVTDPFNSPRMPGTPMLGKRKTSLGPPGIGTTHRGRRNILGFETRLEYVITEWDPPHIIAESITCRPLRWCRTRMTLEAVAEGTKLDTVLEFELRPALKPLWPLIRRFDRGFKEESPDEFKHFIEAQLSPKP